VVDFLSDPFVLLAVVLFAGNGLFDAILVAWLAGRQSKRRLVTYLESEESKPLVDRIAGVVSGKVKEALPPVPTVPEIIEAMPDPPDVSDKLALLEARIGEKLTTQIEAKWTQLGAELSDKMGRVIQANIASAKAAFSAQNRELSEAMDPENDGSFLTEVAGIFMDEDSVKKLGRARRVMKRLQGGGGFSRSLAGGNGQASPQGGYPFGTILNGYVATPSGWVPVQRPQAATPPPVPVPVPAAPTELPPELPPEPAKAK
jgi:hypothetical protein